MGKGIAEGVMKNIFEDILQDGFSTEFLTFPSVCSYTTADYGCESTTLGYTNTQKSWSFV